VEYDLITGNWRWLKGSPTSISLSPIYGTPGVFDPANDPGVVKDVLHGHIMVSFIYLADQQELLELVSALVIYGNMILPLINGDI